MISSILQKVKELAVWIWGILLSAVHAKRRIIWFWRWKWSAGVEAVNLLNMETYSTNGTTPKLLGTIYGQMTQTSLEFVPAAEPVTKRVTTAGCSAQHTMIVKWCSKLLIAQFQFWNKKELCHVLYRHRINL